MMDKINAHDESAANNGERNDPNVTPQQKKGLTQRQKRLATALRQNLGKRKMQQRERISEPLSETELILEIH